MFHSHVTLQTYSSSRQGLYVAPDHGIPRHSVLQEAFEQVLKPLQIEVKLLWKIDIICPTEYTGATWEALQVSAVDKLTLFSTSQARNQTSS